MKRTNEQHQRFIIADKGETRHVMMLGPPVGGPGHTLRIFQTLIHSYIFSGMVHLGD